MARARQLFVTTTIVLLAGAALCGSAWGATAQVISVQVAVEDDFDTVSVAALIAAPGEANRVRVSPGPTAATVLIEELGPVLAVGAGCVSLDAHHARCTSQVGERVVVNAGDVGDVVAASAGVAIDANGGGGTDLLSGADQSDELDGGGGAADVLVGLGGNDVLTDGDGIGGAAIDQDVFDGGADRDTVSYATRSAAMKIDLGKVQQAEDVLTSVENVDGGKGDDQLTGSTGKNTINGGPGKDVIASGAGADSVDGGTAADNIKSGAGSDVVVGGQGKDRIALGDGNDRADDSDQRTPTGGDEITCGAGSDRIVATRDSSVDKLAKSCERFAVNEAVVDLNQIFDVDVITAKLHRVRRSGMNVLVPVKCERSTGSPACRITGRLRGPDGGATLAAPIATRTLKAQKSAILRLRLTPAGQRRVRSAKRFRLVIADLTPKSKIEFDKRARAQARITLP